MKLKVIELDFIENICEFDLNGIHYNLHNQYLCNKIQYSNELKILKLYFQSHDNKGHITLSFSSIDFVTFTTVIDNEAGIIDIIYRGRTVIEGNLVEIKDGNKGYIYLEFTNGGQFEFWCVDISFDINDD